MTRSSIDAALIISVTALVLTMVTETRAEQSDQLCTHNPDSPDKGTPVYVKKGQAKIRHRLPNGVPVFVLKNPQGAWHYVQYAPPGQEYRSEPRRFSGWITKRYLKRCSTMDVP